MKLPVSEGRTQTIENFDTRRHLAHAAQQAIDRKYDTFPIIDVDSHHYEMGPISSDEIFECVEDPVLRQLALSAHKTRTRSPLGVSAGSHGYQDSGGRIVRYPLRNTEVTPSDVQRDIALTTRWMDAMGIDMTIMFPSTLLDLGIHPQIEVEVAMAQAYNRWLVERVLSAEPRIMSMIYLPFSDPEASYETVKRFAGKKGVRGFMVTSARGQAVHNNAFRKTFALIEETGLPLGFHAIYNWFDQPLKLMNKFISVHAIGFPFYNMIHMTNWIFNAMPERFPKLKVVWIESGLAWIPYLMQRLDNEYLMRSYEAPGLKKLPSEYMREMYYTSQPMEVPADLSVLETTFKMINAPTQLLFSSDYPHWDMDLPSVIYDLPFLDEKTKRDILGGNALRLFGLEEPRKKIADIRGAMIG